MGRSLGHVNTQNQGCQEILGCADDLRVALRPVQRLALVARSTKEPRDVLVLLSRQGGRTRLRCGPRPIEISGREVLRLDQHVDEIVQADVSNQLTQRLAVSERPSRGDVVDEEGAQVVDDQGESHADRVEASDPRRELRRLP